MTQDEIIEMAKQAGIDIGMWEKLSDGDDVFGYGIDGTHENLKAFAKLVAEKEREHMAFQATPNDWSKALITAEREACAKLADYLPVTTDGYLLPKSYADAIRARGQA